MGDLDEDGTLVVFGRMAEVIVTGAEKVWPTQVEDVLGRHPGVAEVAVWKRPDPEWGERVVAWVVPAGATVPGLDELRELVGGELARWAAPRELVVVDALPRTAGGKLQRSPGLSDRGQPRAHYRQVHMALDEVREPRNHRCHSLTERGDLALHRGGSSEDTSHAADHPRAAGAGGLRTTSRWRCTASRRPPPGSRP